MEMFKHLCVSNYGICNCNEETKGKFLLEQQRRNQRAAVCWSVVILLILGGMSYHLYFLIATYFEYNYIEITESEPGIPEFPDVTVCNMDGVYVLRSKHGKHKGSLAYYMRTVTENWARLNALAVKEGHDEISLHIMVSGLGKMANYPLESMNYVGYSFDDLIISCTYGTLSKKCDESNTHIFTHHEMNNCYILRLDTSEFSKAGPQNGLTLLLYIGEHSGLLQHDKSFDPYSRDAAGRGWRVFVHEKNTAPPFDDSSNILPGMSTSIALSATKVSRLPHPYTDCSQDKNIPGTDYLMDVHTCKERCLMNAVRGKCGCFPSDLVFNRSNLDAKYCLWYNEEDPLQVFRTYNCEKTLRHQFETHMDDYPEALKCVRQCKWRCKEIEFESASSLSVFPTREAMAWFYSTYLYNNPRNHSLLAWQHYLDDIKNPNKTAEDFSFSWRSRIGFSAVDDKLADWLSSSFARVHVYFATSETMKQIQKPSETVTQPLANIGGSVGLWAGLSILSVVEFVLTLYKNKAKHEKGCKSIVPAHLTT